MTSGNPHRSLCRMFVLQVCVSSMFVSCKEKGKGEGKGKGDGKGDGKSDKGGPGKGKGQ